MNTGRPDARGSRAADPLASRRPEVERMPLGGELEELQRWYLAQCDGDWEHEYGIDIGNINNPGWLLAIHVEGTDLAGREFERMVIERSDGDWFHCWVGVPDRPNANCVRARAFQAACGPENLPEALRIFLDWARR